MPNIVALSGWGQPADALRSAVPDAQFIDYAACADVDEVFALLRMQTAQARVAVGWSLGAQLLVRAVAEQVITPRKLVLIAPPFQFVASDVLALGMGRVTFSQFRENFARAPLRTLQKAYALIAHGDAREEAVRAQLPQAPHEAQLHAHWARWLDVLCAFSCEELEFSAMPETLLIHGGRDAVIAAEQSEHFARRLPQVQHDYLPECGHAPHWHDTPRVAARIAEFIA